MNSHRNRATILGVLFIAATVSAIIGLILYAPILNNPDYLMAGPTSAGQLAGGALAELILVATAVGTSLVFFPFLKRHNETLALGYITFRLLEAVLIVVGVVSFLVLLSLRQAVEIGALIEPTALLAVGTALRAVHDWAFILGPHFMLGINTMLYSYLLYRTGLVPRPLATWGLVGAASIFLAAVLELFGVIQPISTMVVVLALPIATFEMILAGYLIIRGFRAASMDLEPAAVAAG